MEVQEPNLFLKVIGIGLIRKKILEYLPGFWDISSIAQTCKKLYNIILNDKISKKMSYNCHTIKVFVRRKRNIRNANEVPQLQDIRFKRDYTISRYEEDEIEQPDGESFVSLNIIEFDYKNSNVNVSSGDYISFVRKLAQKFSIDSKVQQHLTRLNFLSFRDEAETLTMIHILPFLKHENLNTIIIPMCVLSSDVNKYDGLEIGIFDGFPKLYKLEISIGSGVNYLGIMNNRDIIENILRELSSRKNATLHLKKVVGSEEYSACYFYMFFEFAAIYGFKIILSSKTFLSIRPYDVLSIQQLFNVSMEELVVNYDDVIDGNDCFRRVEGNLQRFRNLKKLELTFKKECDLIPSTGPIKNHKMLEEVVLIKSNDRNELSEEKIENLHNTIKYIASLLPNTVKILKLWKICSLTCDVTKVLAQFMPHLEVLFFNSGTIKDTNCFEVFKNLQVFVIRGNSLSFKLPKTVQLFCFKFGFGFFDKEINDQLVKEYTEVFSKYIGQNGSESERHIFFNDAGKWRNYKHLLQAKYYL